MVRKALNVSIFNFFVIFGLMGALFCYAPSAFSQSCHTFLEVQEGVVKRYKDDSVFLVEVPKHQYLFQGTLDEKGVLDITAYLSFSEFGVRSHLRGSDLYRQMIEHFGLERIKIIKGAWLDGTNYDRFFELLNAGHSEEEAALRTWSGQQARKYGFGKVGRVKVQKSRDLNMTSVYVEFLRANGRTTFMHQP